MHGRQKDFSREGPKVVKFHFYPLKAKKTSFLLKIWCENVNFQNSREFWPTCLPPPFWHPWPVIVVFNFLKTYLFCGGICVRVMCCHCGELFLRNLLCTRDKRHSILSFPCHSVEFTGYFAYSDLNLNIRNVFPNICLFIEILLYRQQKMNLWNQIFHVQHFSNKGLFEKSSSFVDWRAKREDRLCWKSRKRHLT